MNMVRVVKTIALVVAYWQCYFAGVRHAVAWHHGKHSLDEVENRDVRQGPL